MNQNPSIAEELAETADLIVRSLSLGNSVVLRRTKNGHLSIAEYKYHPVSVKRRQGFISCVSDSISER